MDYIDLINIDLSKFDDPEKCKELEKEFFTAFTQDGFVTISGHGISKEVWDTQMDLANTTMTMNPAAKVPYEGRFTYSVHLFLEETPNVFAQSLLKKTDRASTLVSRLPAAWGFTKRLVSHINTTKEAECPLQAEVVY